MPRNTTRRFSMRGMNRESMNDTWFAARITGPSAGTFSRPRALGRYNSLRIGPRTTCFMSQ